jgi:uncharacterized SAM-binding protein YcdF (DUF218 family)
MADRCSEPRPSAQSADAIVVLGCRGSALARRVDRAVQLYREGAAPVLVLSGGGAGPVPEAEHMRRMAIACGVPQEALLLDVVSRNTIENARETARLLGSRGFRSVVLVSDRTHLPRARLLFKFAGLKVVACSAATSPSVSRGACAVIYEFVAVLVGLLRVLLDIRSRRSLRQ